MNTENILDLRLIIGTGLAFSVGSSLYLVLGAVLILHTSGVFISVLAMVCLPIILPIYIVLYLLLKKNEEHLPECKNMHAQCMFLHVIRSSFTSFQSI